MTDDTLNKLSTARVKLREAHEALKTVSESEAQDLGFRKELLDTTLKTDGLRWAVDEMLRRQP